MNEPQTIPLPGAAKPACRTLALLLAAALAAGCARAEVVTTELHRFEVETLADDLRNPWSLALLPDGGYLVTERPGALLRIDADGGRAEVRGLPEVAAVGQGGLLDVALSPDFVDSGRIYFCYVASDIEGHGTELASARLVGDRLEDLRLLFVAEPKSTGGRHFGCRIGIDGAGLLYLTLGDRGRRDNAQDLEVHPGSVVRIAADGSVPADNPLLSRADALPEIYTFGNRNPQGLAIHPDTGEVWIHEHGPQGGDELNRLLAGANYGWPVITYGAEYGSGRAIGEGTERDDVEPPVYYWTPSIAPSGMAFYRGDAFSRWNRSLLLGSLKFGLLVRLEMEGGTVVHEERMLEDALGRIRDVRVGPDGLVYLLTDADPGKLVRLRPAQ